MTQKLFKEGYVAPKLRVIATKHYTIVIAIWLTLSRKHPYLKSEYIFYFLRFLSSITARTFYRIWLCICVHFVSTWVHSQFFVGSVLLIFLVFCIVLLCVFTFWVPCCDVRYYFRIKRCSVRMCPQMFVGGPLSYWGFFLFAHGDVQHVVPPHVFTLWATCCDVCYDFRIKTMFRSSSPPVVCRRYHVLFTLFVFACA